MVLLATGSTYDPTLVPGGARIEEVIATEPSKESF